MCENIVRLTKMGSADQTDRSSIFFITHIAEDFAGIEEKTLLKPRAVLKNNKMYTERVVLAKEMFIFIIKNSCEVKCSITGVLMLLDGLQTSVPDGNYCDVITGQLERGACTGKMVVVRGGKANIAKGNTEEDGVIAIHIEVSTIHFGVKMMDEEDLIFLIIFFFFFFLVFFITFTACPLQ